MRDSFDLILEDTEKFKDYFLGEEEKFITFLPKFSSINIIVGANNSGKSRFIRNLMNFANFSAVDDLLKIRKLIPIYNIEVDQTNQKIDEKIHFNQHKADSTYYSGRNPHKEYIKTLKDNKLNNLQITSLNNFLTVVNENISKIQSLKHLGIENDYLLNFNEIDDCFLKQYNDFKNYYIPTLRSAHSLFHFNLELNKYSKIENDVFLQTLNNYYKLDKIDVEVFTGIHLYKEILNARNSKREIRQSFEKFESFIGKYFFDNKKIDIVAEFNKDESLLGNNITENISVYIEGEKDSKKLYDLGDGIQALIILMYKIFMAENNSFIYIDEPELNLHPGMQRLFLDQITSNKVLRDKKITYIITTHSNHFLDLTIEKDCVSIYSFSSKNIINQEKQFVIKNVNRGDNKLLQDLGVNNSSVFMANCSIWVEGISDRNYIKAFLKSYRDFLYKDDPKKFINLKEDIDFAFFEYAGSNIDHYIFENEIEIKQENLVINDIKALALSNRIFLLADSDAVIKTKSKQKFERLKKLESIKSDNFKPKIIWDVREIENLLTNEIWEKVLINFCNEKLVKQYEEEIQSKIELALGKIDVTKYKKEYIGNFLSEVREEIKKKGNVYILNKSFYEIKKNDVYGSIVDKRGLSERVLEANFSWDVFSKNKEIKKLTIEIYNFITQK